MREQGFKEEIADKQSNVSGDVAPGKLDLNLSFARTRASSVGQQLSELKDSPRRSGMLTSSIGGGIKTPRSLRGSPRSETGSPRYQKIIEDSKQFSSQKMSPRIGSDTEDFELKTLYAQRDQLKTLTVIDDFAKKSDRLLSEIIPLCAILDNKYAEDGLAYLSKHPAGVDVLASLPLSVNKYSLTVLYDLIAKVDSRFIKAQLFDALKDANVNKKTKAYALMSSVLNNWEGMSFNPPLNRLSGKDGLAPIDQLIAYRLETTLSPDISRSEAVNFSNTEEKILVEQFLQMTDLEILFKLNAYHLPGIGGSRKRNVYEASVSNFLKNFKQSINHSDICNLKNKTMSEFHDEAAYAFYFLEEIVQLGSVFTRYTVDVIDNICDVIVDGWKKIKDLLILKYQQNPETYAYYTKIEAKLSILNKVRQDELFDEVRSSSSLMGDESENSETFVDLNISNVLDDLRLRFETFEMEQNSWLGIIYSVMQAHPNSDASAEISKYNEISAALEVCIHKSMKNIAIISPFFKENKRNLFGEAYSKLNNEHKSLTSVSPSNAKVIGTRSSGAAPASTVMTSSPKPLRHKHGRSQSSVSDDSGVKLRASPSTGDLSGSAEKVLKRGDRRMVVQTRRNAGVESDVKRKSRGDYDRSILSSLSRK